MNDVIRLLPDSVANQIAAGEVIQRPASVIKELVVNAVDAGADDIRITIKDAGRTLIQVSDNGCGMSETDARMAFERHATSKIRSADDLFSLHTMGFRGEALPSICAISMVEVRTRRDNDTIGTRLVINGSKVECQEPDMCGKGTTIMVKNIFFNVPARRKFLKSDNVELSNIMREFERLALVNTGVRMVIDTGAKVIDLRKASFRQRIADIWKGSLANHLIAVEADTSIVRISGFISRPEGARRRGAMQYLIVNGRNMRHPYFHKALTNCYESLIATDTQPCYFLKFEVDPASIDVNIHPTKNEIKFDNESQIWSILTAAVKASLGKNAAVPSIDFDHDAVPVEPLMPGEEAVMPETNLSSDFNPFTMESASSPSFAAMPGNSGHSMLSPRSGSSNTTKGWESLYSSFMAGSRHNARAHESTDSTTSAAMPAAAPGVMERETVAAALPDMETDTAPPALCLQYALKYIVTTTREGVMIIDQHRAHLKILFERFINRARHKQSVTQKIMFPDTLEVPPELQSAFDEAMTGLTEAGFIFENEGNGRFAISGVPAMLEQTNPADTVLKLLESITDGSESYGLSSGNASEEMTRRIAYIMARSAAITRGRRLLPEEMENIVAELFSLPDPAFSPSGRRIFARLDEASILRMMP